MTAAASELDRIRDALAGEDVGQDEGLAFEVATLQAAWEEMHREAKRAVRLDDETLADLDRRAAAAECDRAGYLRWMLTGKGREA